jgi:hypothetical protein
MMGRKNYQVHRVLLFPAFVLLLTPFCYQIFTALGRTLLLAFGR